MKLIVGLGNPGPKYQTTWHNLGFLAIDRFYQNHEDEFKPAKNKPRLQAQITEGQVNQEKIILAKPQTFMNHSGQAVSALMKFYKITPDDLWIIHDDIDLPLGALRISQDASAGGHKGIQSIIDQLATKKFDRFRLGIKNNKIKTATEKYVLQKIKPSAIMEKTINQTCRAVDLALAENLQAAMNQFN